MNTSATLTRPYGLDSLRGMTGLTSFTAKPTAAPEEDALRFSTTDGSMMTYSAGTNAVSNGAGIFIGGYFVGLTDESLLTGSMPFIKY
ncbi:hypothetical protein GCM10023188_47160 [Pontibacter saemangeumensis]|uniref:Uncharacterized protein n=1 Tax=Pontibacter saemangeumensis TaxID=1084525 RepID=A0ABP8M6Q5_9BACT